MFKGMFGKSKQAEAKASASAAAKTIDTIGKLTEQETQLGKRKELLEKRVEQEQDKLKQLLKDKKRNAAMLALKKKKMYEEQINNLDNMILRISEQRIMLENQQTTADMLSAMSQAAKASKQTLKEVNIDNVDQVMEEINDQNDEMRTIQDALGQPIGAAADLDDLDLLDELKELEEEVLDEQLLQPAAVPTNKVPSLPEPGNAVVNKPQKTPEELELEKLEKEMLAA